MPPFYRRRVRCAFAEPAKPKRKPAKKRSEMSELEKIEADMKRIARKQLKDAKDEWEKTLPKAWDGPETFSWPAGTLGIYKSDAKTSFGLTDKDIATLPHEAIQCSPKTFYALRDVSKLAADKFAANALPAEFTVAGEPKGAEVRFFKKGNTHPNRRVRTNWSDRGGMPWFYIKDHYLKDKAA